MLRKLRIILAAFFWTAVTLLFLDFSGTLHAWLGWTAKIQFLPAVLALNVAVIAGLVLLTLVFGRVYCSVICPLGVFQDIVSWIHGRRIKKAKFRFKFKPARNIIRYGIMVLFILLLAAGISSIAMLIAPYSAWGRIASNLLSPLYLWCNNLLALASEHFGSYAFYTKEVWLKSLPTFIVAAVTLVVIIIFAWKSGREWCNTICPVGSALSILSRFSLFGPVIDTEKCRNCGLCGRACKASCIDTENHRIDYSRCVECMDCISNCKDGAIRYRFRYGSPAGKRKQEISTSRRAFMTGAAIAATSITMEAQDMKLDGGLADIEKKKAPKRDTAIVPAGAGSLKHFQQHCISCQLCVSACPNNVLRPSVSFKNLMQPEMSFERGYCRPECNECSSVCPAGAIVRITPEEKSSVQIGHAVINLDLCVVNTDDVSCGNCARHCPSGAIKLVNKGNGENSLKIPSVDTSKCIGCGACEYLCPARPLSAIHVEGNLVHTIK